MIQALSAQFGHFVIDTIHFLGGSFILFRQSVRDTFNRPFYLRLVIDQIYQIGVRSLSLVFATAASTGMVMAIQFGYGLEAFGGKLYVPKLVALSMVRELGPVFTSLMLAARVGAGIASELGSMNVTQQIDAIRALGTSPIKKIVIPRIIATLISLPALTILATTLGVVAGAMVAYFELGIDFFFYLNKVATTIKIQDYVVGVAKTFFFAIMIAVPSCYFGMTTTGGTRGVGVATTKAVVVSSIMIVIGDFFLTKLFWVLIKWTS